VAPPSAGGDELIDSETGVVPPSNAPEDLLTALRALAGYPERRAAMGRQASERARAFDVESVVERFEQLYLSVTAEAAQR
jgi:glycosyltransferase involved in cell wall biosynthesis